MIHLIFDLEDLPSSQHRAGLAGLVLLLRWKEALDRDRDHDTPTGVESVSATRLEISIDQQNLREIFDLVFAASLEERSSNSPIPGKDPMRVNFIPTPHGPPKKLYIYPTPVPTGVFLPELDPSPDGIWIKLWRDMVWSIPRGVPASRKPYEERVIENPSHKDADAMWAQLQKKKPVDLSSTLLLGAQATTAEGVPFRDTPQNSLLLHFWPLVAQTFVPQKQEEGKRKPQGYAIVIPDVSDLAAFCHALPRALKARSSDKIGYRPADALLDSTAEAALRTFSLFEAPEKIMVSVDVYHTIKDGNNVRVLGLDRYDVTSSLRNGYHEIRSRYKNPVFIRQRISNLLGEKKWYEGMHPSDPKSFHHDADKAFQHEPDRTWDIMHKMAGLYIRQRAKNRFGRQAHGSHEKVAKETFMAARRARTPGSFIQFFVTTFGSMAHAVEPEEYEIIATVLKNSIAVEKTLRPLTLLAIAAQSR